MKREVLITATKRDENGTTEWQRLSAEEKKIYEARAKEVNDAIDKCEPEERSVKRRKKYVKKKKDWLFYTHNLHQSCRGWLRSSWGH